MSNKNIKDVIVLLAHGSLSNSPKKELVSIKKKMSRCYKNGNLLFHCAFLQFNKPRFKDCMGKILRNQKFKMAKIVILPVFVSSGNHLLHDVPRIINGFKKTYKDINVKLAKPLGSDKLMIKLLYKRYREVCNTR